LWFPGSIQVGDDSIIVVSRKSIVEYNYDGDHISTIECPYPDCVLYPASVTPTPNGFFVGFLENGSWKSGFLSQDSQITQRIQTVYTQSFRLNEQLFGLKRPSEKEFIKLFTSIDLAGTKKSKSFFRQPKDFSRGGEPVFAWCAEKEPYILVAVSNNNHLYILSERFGSIEKKSGNQTPGNYPKVTISTPGFNYSKSLEFPESVVELDKKLYFSGRKMTSNSQTIFFGAIEDGFVYCYSVPDELDGIVIGNHVAIRFLDDRLQPVGPVLERYGQVAGVNDAGLVVFYPDGPEPAVTEAGMKEHYGVDRIEDREQLLGLYRRFRALEKRTLDPVVEIIPFPAD